MRIRWHVLSSLLVVCLLFSGAGQSSASSMQQVLLAGSRAYQYARTITIDPTKCGASNSSNFPVLFSGTYAYLATVANGGNVTNSSGYDIIFTSDAAGATKLDHEIEIYTATTGLVVFWVRVPTVSAATDTVIYLWYGNSAISTSQENVTGVWDSNYKGVWHLPNGTTLTALDSTSNANNLTATGSPPAVAGKVDGGVTVSTGKYLGATLAAAIGTTNTVSAWVKFTSLPVSTDTGMHSAYAVDGAETFIWRPAGGVTYFALYGSAFVLGSTPSTGTWYYLVATRDGTTTNGYKLYLNAAVDVTTTRPSADSGSTFRIGRTGAGVNEMDGAVDEVRLSSSVRSVDWAIKEYNNMSSPSTFYAIGSAR